MTPSLFTMFSSDQLPLDEYHLTQQLGREKAQEILENHWATWITESDFQQLSQWGFNTVRIPIGYWAFLCRNEDPYVQGQVKYLDQALEWARNHNIKVWIDLHGVPGSQNGFDNSGLRDALEWQDSRWSNMEDTYKALALINERYAGSNYYDVISGIEVVNEPLGPSLDVGKIKEYYENAYDDVRAHGAQGVIVHDAFLPVGAMNGWLNNNDGFWNVILDHHQYQVFSVGELQRTYDQHVEVACNIGRSYSQENKWRVTGEWSAAFTDCAPMLNGVYRGARFDGTYQNGQALGTCQGINDINAWPEDKKQATRRYVEAQMDAYDQGSGWIFWSYKTESTLEWDVRRLIENGLFPQPLDNRQYPNQCGF